MYDVNFSGWKNKLIDKFVYRMASINFIVKMEAYCLRDHINNFV